MTGLLLAFAWFLTISAAALAVFACAVAADAVDKTWLSMRARRALPCLCCTSRPYTVDDCNCREDCGQVHCQARDFEEVP